MQLECIIPRKEAKRLRLKTYFTGKKCRHSHLSERVTSTGICVECNQTHRREAIRLYSAIHNKERYKTNKELHPEKEVEYNKRKYAKHKKKIRAAQSVYYLDNRETVLATHSAWRERNPGKKAIYDNARKARKAGYNGQNYTKEDVDRILKLQRGKCAYCRESLGNGYQVDHVVPLAKGGTNASNNIQLLCKKKVGACNQRKNAKDPIDYAQSIGLML